VTSGGDDVDRQLVTALVRRRDERAFSSLYERHTTYLYRFALRLTAGDEDVAQDLVHDAWVRAVQRVAGFEWRSTLRTWLAGFVVGLWRERQRQESRETPLDESYGDNGAALPASLDRIDVERALASLAPGFREVLVLHDIEGYTHEDIAVMLDVQPGTSKSQLSRARAAMRRALGDSTNSGSTNHG
jgi:RNA polymerase sigma-70 factor, ECF subfamily